jgi:hypothetical protein
MLNKITSSVLLFWNKMKSGKIDFPLKNIKTIAIKPSEAIGELIYSLPLVETLQKKYRVTLLIPKNQDTKYFRRLRVKTVAYSGKNGLIGLSRLKTSGLIFLSIWTEKIVMFFLIYYKIRLSPLYSRDPVSTLRQNRKHNLSPTGINI